ncbi:virion core protein [Yokapox virus]|uniref:Virion core protein n=1 Tax=Yokapox virus TaxID=1076255 RepID=G3EIG5_9POXV|nr:virion core protein [Yokapox virus]AEN03676.1 virion core protein [Yokapox virus]
MSIDVKKIINLLNYNMLFPGDIKDLLNEKYVVIERKSNGTPVIAHVYDIMARFDNLTIYRIAKFLFRNRPDVIRILFLENIEPLIPIKSINLTYEDDKNNVLDNNNIGTKTALLELFNSFVTGKSEPVPYYYLSLRKDINHIITK